jgi:hypothetical protein
MLGLRGSARLPPNPCALGMHERAPTSTGLLAASAGAGAGLAARSFSLSVARGEGVGSAGLAGACEGASHITSNANTTQWQTWTYRPRILEHLTVF